MAAPFSKRLELNRFLDLVSNAEGRETGGASLAAEGIGSAIHIGPVIARCPASDYKMDYVKARVF
jgi:hypothetical protein